MTQLTRNMAQDLSLWIILTEPQSVKCKCLLLSDRGLKFWGLVQPSVGISPLAGAHSKRNVTISFFMTIMSLH